MNRIRIALSIASLVGLSSFALAHEGASSDPACADKRAAFHQKKLERFDLDKDGTLSDAERAPMHAERRSRHEQRRAEMHDRFDANRDGVLDETERAAMRAERVQRMLGRLDVDKDGELSVEEVRCTRLAADFAKLDLDSSGKLSAGELAAAKRMHHGEHAMRRVLKKRVATV
jgi:hypothetical protein